MSKNNKNKEFAPLEVSKKDIIEFISSETKPPIGFNIKNRLLTGFTLIEILVALAIFVIISIVLGGVVIQMAELQTKITSRNQQISELRFALDYISGVVANTQNPRNAACIPINTNFEVIDIDRGIRFINVYGNCQEIFLYPPVGEFRKIQTSISANHTRGQLAQPIDLTSNIITRFNIHLMGNLIAPDDILQPRITISITSNIRGLDLPITVQRSVSRIRLDN